MAHSLGIARSLIAPRESATGYTKVLKHAQRLLASRTEGAPGQIQRLAEQLLCLRILTRFDVLALG